MLDGLRGIAVLLVLCYHTYLYAYAEPDGRFFGLPSPFQAFFRAGWLGVELFFFISGFVLLYPAAVRFLTPGPKTSQTLSEFAYRRFIKIVPSYAIILAVTAVASVVQYAPRVNSLGADVLTYALFLQTFFGDRYGGLNPALWTLSVEVQFYVLFPIAAWCLLRRPLITAGALVAVALLYRQASAPCCLGIDAFTQQLPPYLDMFAMGMLTAYAFVWVRRSGHATFGRSALWTVLAIASACLVVWLVMHANEAQNTPNGRNLWTVTARSRFALAIAMFVFSSLLAARWFRAVFSNGVLVFISIVSYNVYLWHSLIMIWLYITKFVLSNQDEPRYDSLWRLKFVLLSWTLTFAIATLITYFVERPLLSTVKPHPFAFNWGPFVRNLGSRNPV